MKVIIYGDIGGSGGYVRYCKGLLSSDAIPDDVEVWFISSLPFFEQLAPLDPKVHVIQHPWIISKNRIFRYLWYLWVYPKIVRNIRPDIEFYPLGQLRVYLRKALTISTCHNLLLFDQKELNRIENKEELQYFQSYRKNQIRSFKKSNAIIFLSKHSQEVVCNEIHGIKQSCVIAHGLDPLFRIPSKRSYEFGKRIKLLYVSPFYLYKNQIEVLRAVKLLRDFTGRDIYINLIGGGNSSASSQFKKFATNENYYKFVFVCDYMNYHDLLKEYLSADIFVFASSTETFGITLLEAMGARLPIVCSNSTGLSEILKDAGVYFNPKDPNSIFSSLNELIDNVKLREILGERAYNYSMEYTWERCATETFHYIKNGILSEK